MVSVRDRISALRKTLTTSEQKVAQALLSHPEPFLLSISELAQRAAVAEATVVRFYRRLGFSSYQEMKVALAQEAAQDISAAVYEEIEPGDSPAEILEKVTEQSVDSLRTTKALVDREAFARAANWVAGAERLFFIGVGASGAIAQDAAHKFLRLGGTCIALTDSHLQAIAAAHLRSGDVVVAISHSGESVEILDAVRLAKEHTDKLIAITGYANSSLCHLVPTALVTAARETRYRSDAMTSRLAQLVLIDALYVVTVCRKGRTAIDAINLSRLAVARRKT